MEFSMLCYKHSINKAKMLLLQWHPGQYIFPFTCWLWDNKWKFRCASLISSFRDQISFIFLLYLLSPVLGVTGFFGSLSQLSQRHGTALLSCQPEKKNMTTKVILIIRIIWQNLAMRAAGLKHAPASLLSRHLQEFLTTRTSFGIKAMLGNLWPLEQPRGGIQSAFQVAF